MSILNYLKSKNGLPDINSPLSSCLPSQAIALANSKVAKATNDNKKKCGQYKKYHWNISLIQAILLIAHAAMERFENVALST